MLVSVILSSPQQVKRTGQSYRHGGFPSSGVSTIELILALVLLVSVVGSTMYYLRSVLPGLEARAFASYTFETGALGPAPLGARVGHPEALPSGPLNEAPRVFGPLAYFSYFPGAINGVVSFERELEGLRRLLSVTTAPRTGFSESWCLALFDPGQADLQDTCRLSAAHIVPEAGEIGPEGACKVSDAFGCLSEESEFFLRAYGCVDDSTPGRKPLLVGLYPAYPGSVFAQGCAVRAVDLTRSYDIRHTERVGP
jgi:hypothetical protein